MTVVEFAGQLPEELQSLYVNEPHLAGWSCLSGAMASAGDPQAAAP